MDRKFYRIAARIDVEDNGPGVEENIQDQIFLPMISGKSQGRRPGSGDCLRNHQASWRRHFLRQCSRENLFYCISEVRRYTSRQQWRFAARRPGKRMKSTAAPVWIVDDDESIRWVLTEALTSSGIESRSFSNAESALQSFRNEHPKIFVTDIRMEGMDGLSLLDEVQKSSPRLPVIVMTAYSDLDTTVDSFQRGATEYLPKPFDIDYAVSLIQRVMKNGEDSEESHDTSTDATTMIGESVAMQEVFRAIGKLSNSDINVLITGESGTGKELVARALFENSIRSKNPFIAINAAAIPVDLLESELFGHEKGAFTGANQRRIGRFEQADRGTLFLDEIGDMPHDLQSRLLRVMSEGKFYRVGGVNQISVDVRIIAATNQNLQSLVEENKFRNDLYHRLNVVHISLPPLRERTTDIPQFVHYFLAQAARQLNTEEKSITPQAMECLQSYHWPGNVREIENVCRSATVMAPSKSVTVHDLPPEIENCTLTTPVHAQTWEHKLDEAIKAMINDPELTSDKKLRPAVERVLLKTVLKFTGGSKHRAAELLNWNRNTVTRKIKDL